MMKINDVKSTMRYCKRSSSISQTVQRSLLKTEGKKLKDSIVMVRPQDCCIIQNV